MGTGVLIDPRGYIITDYHVVDGVREIHVTRADGERHIAKLVARDKDADLAVLKIDCSTPLPVIAIGTSADLMPGETVIAVGNAYGYEHTVTRGIIGALHRSVQVSDAQYYDDLIQTDASINPGNSGGPLLNIDGEMIGINVAVRAGAQGIGFAIPVDRVVAVAANLLGSCNAGKTWIGVESLTDAAPQKGAVVGSIAAGSPAAVAGLAAGDVIVSVGGDPIQRSLDFQRAVLERKPGDALRLAVRRSGGPLSLTLKLVAAPESTRLAEQPAWEILGVDLKPISADEFRKAAHDPLSGGPGRCRGPSRQPCGFARHHAGRRAGGDAHLGDADARKRLLYPQAARLRNARTGEVLHPPRRRNAVRLPSGPRSEDGPALGVPAPDSTAAQTGDCPDFCVRKNGVAPFHGTIVSLSTELRTGPLPGAAGA